MTSAAREDAGQSGYVGQEPAALDENVEVIKSWERDVPTRAIEIRAAGGLDCEYGGQRSRLVASRARVHFLDFGEHRSDSRHRPVRSVPVSAADHHGVLEAIFLALFVLASQSRLARQSDKRSHLNLQVDLLAEREMTAVLRMLQDIARHLNVSTTVTADHSEISPSIPTFVVSPQKMEEIAEPESPPECPENEGGTAQNSVALSDGDSSRAAGDGQRTG